MKTRNGDDIMGKIHLEGADNARDLGGLKTTEGAVIREKKLIRSNRLSKLTQNEQRSRRTCDERTGRN